eukprot:4785291-Amphidinium_carterae.1
MVFNMWTLWSMRSKQHVFSQDGACAGRHPTLKKTICWLQDLAEKTIPTTNTTQNKGKQKVPRAWIYTPKY